MSLRTKQAGLALAAAVIVAAGVVSGRALKGGAESGYAFDYNAPAYEANSPAPGYSKAGFSGFGETPGLDGATQLSGKVVSVTAQELVIEASTGVTAKLRLANPGGITRIEASSRAVLRAGATILVLHRDGSDEAEAVLVIESP